VLEEITLPEPKAGEAKVRHHAIGVNFIDTYHRSGLYPVPLPSGLGSEAAGVVEQVGPGVTSVRVGERVAYAGAGAPAAYAEARLIPADRLVPVPDDITDDVAAAALLKGMTAEFLIHRTFPVQPGLLFQTIRDGLKIEIGQRFPLAEAAQAHRALESRGTVGSTLLTL
jgi:NADPH2:quinone reductase